MFSNNMVLLWCVLVLCCAVVIDNVEGRECYDCVSISSCEEAKIFMNANTEEKSREKKERARCSPGHRQFKICCSDFKTEVKPTEKPMHPKLETKVILEERFNDDISDKTINPNNCGKTDGRRIIGGQVAHLYELPWMVLISYIKLYTTAFECAGTIINSRYVLTAAHCAQDEYDIEFVRVGEFDYKERIDCQGEGNLRICESHIQNIKVERKIPHPSFQIDRSRENDIALLLLEKPIDFSFKNVAPICLPLRHEFHVDNLVGKNVSIAGWGLQGEEDLDSRILKADIQIRDDCRPMVRKTLCAGDGKKDTCKGDSGGPLTMEIKSRIFQIGITSFGTSKCGSGNPAFYTDVSKFMDWIQEQIEKN